MKQITIFDVVEVEDKNSSDIEEKVSKYNFDFNGVNEPYIKYITNNDKFKKIMFEALKSVNNPKSIHGIYPYRGKISAIDAKQILEQLPQNISLLDPFAGSGTIVSEAQKLGMNAFGVDNNPLAFDLCKAKVERKPFEEYENELNTLIAGAEELLHSNSEPEMPEAPKKHFHEQTSREIMAISMYFESMSDYVKGCYYGAIALTARGCNHYKWTSSTVGKNIEPKQYINFFDKLLAKVKKHYESKTYLPEANVILGDSREISNYIPPKSIDVVFTSPPYFDALDYTAYYGKIIYEIHEKDRLEIKEGLIQKFADYKENMIKVLDELDKVTKDDALIIFVVGDKKAKDGVIDGGEFFASLRDVDPAYVVERVYSGSQSQIFDTLNKTKRKEQIVVWDKTEGF